MNDTPDHALVRELCAFAEARAPDPFRLDGLTELEADVLGTITAIGVIGNGGLGYWFQGKDRAQTLRVADGFDRMGLAAQAEALRRSLTLFPGGAPPQDLGERQAWLAEHRTALQERFAPLDSVIWGADPGFDLAAARYIAGRRRELLQLDPGFGPLLQRYDADERTRVKLLAGALGALPPDARSPCERAIASGALTLALDLAMDAGAEQGRDFWHALAEVARRLGHSGPGADDKASRCTWWARIADEGATVGAVTFLGGDDDPVFRTGHEVAWNVGTEPAGLFRSRKATLFMEGRGWARPGVETLVYLLPPDPRATVASSVVLHVRGRVVGRGTVVEQRLARGR